MQTSPRYYVDIRDLLGNRYDRSGVGLKIVPYSLDVNGDLIPNDPETHGLVMVKEINRGFYVADVEQSNMFDLYLHKSDEGYEILRSMLWIAGMDIDEKLSEKRAFRVGSGHPVLYTAQYDQIINFNVRNYNDSVKPQTGDSRVIVQAWKYETGSGSVSVVMRPTQYAAPRERAKIVFVKEDTSEVRETFLYVI